MKKTPGIFLFVAFLLNSFSVFSQNKKLIDSLSAMMESAKADTTKINYMLDLAWELKQFDPVETRNLLNDAIRMSNKIKDQKRVSRAYQRIAVTYDIKGDPDSAIYFHEKAIAIMIAQNNEVDLGRTYSNLGTSWMKKREFDSSEVYYKRSMDIYEYLKMEKEYARSLFNYGRMKQESNQFAEGVKMLVEAARLMDKYRDTISLSAVYNSLGIAYFSQKNFPKAAEYWEQSLKMRIKNHAPPYDIATGRLNLSNVYRDLKKPKEARHELDAALNLAVLMNNKVLIAEVYNNLALLHRGDPKADSALKYHKLALKIREEIGDKKGLAQSYVNLGATIGSTGNDQLASEYFEKAYEIYTSGQVKNPPLSSLYYLYHSLSACFLHLGNYKNAFYFQDKLADVKDSMINLDNQKVLEEVEGKYHSEKKALEIAKLESEAKAQNAELATEKTFRYSLIGGLLLVILFSFFIYSRFRIIRKQKHIIEKQHQLTQHQKEIIEEKQMEIIDSIRYAKRIQLAQIPTEKRVFQMLFRLKKS
jgi:tetratricopeptide (TPR) repeat protein